jgi:type I restriction enzyme S subunit
VLRLTALTSGVVDVTAQKEGDWSAHEAQLFLIHRGDFLVARGSGSLDLVGRGALVTDEPPAVAFPDTMIRVRVDLRILDAEYLRRVWDADIVRLQIRSAARTTAGIYKVNQQTLSQIALPIPPLAEQRRIADELDVQLSRLDQGIAGIRALVGGVTVTADSPVGRLRRSILEAAFTGRLVPQDPLDEPAELLLKRTAEERVTAHQGDRPRPSKTVHRRKIGLTGDDRARQTS